MIRGFDNIEEVAALLKEREIDVALLCEFIQEAVESQKIYDSLTERVSKHAGASAFTKEFLENLKRFCELLSKVKLQYEHLIYHEQYVSEKDKRIAMIRTVDKFLELLNE
jgi:hypothetical protein